MVGMKYSFHEIFPTNYFSIEQSNSLEPDGEPYYRLKQSDSAICCILDTQGDFILVRQFRPNLGYVTTEFPAGMVEPGESPLNAAQREIAEETGLQCKLLHVGSFRLMMNRTTNYEHVFFGIDAIPLPGKLIETGMEMVHISRPHFIELVLSGQFEQVAALGILQVTSLRLNIDVLKAKLEYIHKNFNIEVNKPLR
jgi:8-oxo-dGTP pyrophosphatase MutT (NUDIX family)